MRPGCETPVSDGMLLDYWARDLAEGHETERVEAHLFSWGECVARLERLAAVGPGLAALVREGRISGIVSRALVNRMQRDGIHVRMYSVMPGETVPCAVFPGDDLVVCALRADFSGVHALSLSVTGTDWQGATFDDVPAPGPGGDVLWATPAALVRQMPSMRLELSLATAGAGGAELGRYALDHEATAG